MIKCWTRCDQALDTGLRPMQDLLLLFLRCWVAWIFFKSGMLKYQSWEVTLQLFAYEYAVPLLPSDLAAVLATVAELILPPLLCLGLITRPAAFALFMVNIVAVVSYPDISPSGIKDHQLWGLGLLWITLLGAGRLSADRGLIRWVQYRS